MKIEKQQRSVVTTYSGRAWINMLEGKGPFRGSFSSKEAAIAVGRAHAADARTVHLIHDEDGEIVEVRSYEQPADFSPLS